LLNETIKILGLKNCDKCREAQKKLNNLGYCVELTDIRKNPIRPEQIKQLISLFGGQILNKRSTTYRSLTSFEKNSSLVQLIQKYPALIKRPVIMSSKRNSIGWNSEIIEEWSRVSKPAY